jgi:hypothetical protein
MKQKRLTRQNNPLRMRISDLPEIVSRGIKGS